MARTSTSRGGTPTDGPVERLWTAREVADFLGIAVATLHQWRYLGTGPAAYRVGKYLRYSPATVRAWLETDCMRRVGA